MKIFPQSERLWDANERPAPQEKNLIIKEALDGAINELGREGFTSGGYFSALQKIEPLEIMAESLGSEDLLRHIEAKKTSLEEMKRENLKNKLDNLKWKVFKKQKIRTVA